MSSLLSKAKVRLINAENDMKNISLDDAYLDDACANVQMSLELTLKYAVNIIGEDYIENHDIRAQLNILNKHDLTVPNEDRLRIIAAEINSWHTASAYNTDFLASVKDVTEVIAITKEVIAWTEKLVIEQEPELTSIPTHRLHKGR